MHPNIDLDTFVLPTAAPVLAAFKSPHRIRAWRNSAKINAGGLLAMCATLEVPAQDDVSTSLLFAQLAANKAQDRFADPRAWTDHVIEVMESIGWRTQQATSYGQRAFGKNRNLRQTALDAFERGYGGPSPLVTRTFNAATSLPEYSPGARLWNRYCLRYGKGVSLMGLADGDASGDPVLYMMFAAFQFDRPITGMLDGNATGKWSDEFLVLTLDTNIYAPLRDDIENRLGTWLNTDTHEIAL